MERKEPLVRRELKEYKVLEGFKEQLVLRALTDRPELQVHKVQPDLKEQPELKV
jgi:hypothetical protein